MHGSNGKIWVCTGSRMRHATSKCKFLDVSRINRREMESDAIWEVPRTDMREVPMIGEWVKTCYLLWIKVLFIVLVKFYLDWKLNFTKNLGFQKILDVFIKSPFLSTRPINLMYLLDSITFSLIRKWSLYHMNKHHIILYFKKSLGIFN